MLQQLPSLTDDQLRELELRIKFLRKGTPAAPQTIERHNLWLLSGVFNVLRKRGLIRDDPPLEICRKIAPRCLDVASEAQRMLLQGASRQLTAAERLMLGNVAAEALSAQVAYKGPIGLKRMLQNLHKVPDAFDASFPRYLEAGLVSFIISGSLRR